MNLKYDYINWEKKNLFSITRRKVSKDFENILFRIDAYSQNLLHFRYWDRNRMERISPKFLYIDKKIIKCINNELEKKFSCIKCGECKKICPPQAINMKKGKVPKVNKSKCIRCWCCAEVCPINAISKSSRPLIGKIFFKR